MESKDNSYHQMNKDKINEDETKEKKDKENKKDDEEEYDIDITSKSTYEEVSKFLREKLHISDDTIEELGLDGEALFYLEYDDIKEINDLIKEKEMKSLKKFIEKRKNLLKDNQSKLIKDKAEKKDNAISINRNEEKVFIKEKEVDAIENQNKYIIQQLNDKSKYNIFVLIGMKKNSYNKIKILFYYNNGLYPFFFKSYNLKYRLINVSSKNINNQDFYELFLIQIELEDLKSELYIKIINDKNKELKGWLNVKNIKNYFSFENFHFDNTSPDNEIFSLTNDTIFIEFYNYFFTKNSINETKFKKDMMSSLINHKNEVI